MLAVALGLDLRTSELSGATATAGVSYTLHVEGLSDRSGNLLDVVDLPIVVADPTAYEVVEDTEPPQVLAVMDASDGLYLLANEPVVEDQVSLADSITVERAGSGVTGVTTRVAAKLLKWEPADQSTWLIGGQYSITQIQLVDLSGNAVTVSSLPTFAHLAATENNPLAVFEMAEDSQPHGQSEYGVRNLFQGREWHGELGLYYYRARWYEPERVASLERDPEPGAPVQSLYSGMLHSPCNVFDPSGRVFQSAPTSREAVGAARNSARRADPGSQSRDTSYEDFTGENIQDTHDVLRERQLPLSDRNFRWYRTNLRLQWRFRAQANWYTTRRVRDQFIGAEFSGTGGGWGPQKTYYPDVAGGGGRTIVFGMPDPEMGRLTNLAYQRARLFQVERIIEIFHSDFPHALRLPFLHGARPDSESMEEFWQYYIRAHRKATYEILNSFPKFRFPKAIEQRILTAALSAIYIYAPEIRKGGVYLELEHWIHRHYGYESEVRHRKGADSWEVGETKPRLPLEVQLME